MTLPSPTRVLPMLSFLVAVCLLSFLLAASQFDPRINPHSHFGRADQCAKCHVYYRAKLEPDRFLPECSDYCIGCHSAEKLGRSHPIGVRPRDKYSKMTVPKDYRLDDDGRLMCLTCHKAHGPFLSTVKSYKSQKPESLTPPSGVLRYYRTYFLRMSDPEKGHAPMCDGCHSYL